MTMVIEIILGLGLLIVSVIAGIFAFEEFKNFDGKNIKDLALCSIAVLYFGILGLIMVTGNLGYVIKTIGSILMMEI